MKYLKRVAVVGALVAVVATAVAPAANAATLAQRVNKLENQVSSLKRQNDCLVRYGMSQWWGYAPYAGGDGLYAYDPFAEWDAANFDGAVDESIPPDVWVLATKPSSFCKSTYSKGAKPSWWATASFARPAGAPELERVRGIERPH
jgi:hypothetical protein